jgi:Domain of unknown function (DUF4371)
MKNGEIMEREWLVYSKAANAIFCCPCKLFNSELTGQLLNEGLNDWQHASSRLKKHETSKSHFKAINIWQEAKTRMLKKSSVNMQSYEVYLAEKQKWRNILDRVISIIKYLAEHNLALKGSSDVLFEQNNGNFLGLVELLAKYDSILKEHIDSAKTSEHRKNLYLSKNIQNEIIYLMGNKIMQSIFERIQASKYYSVILDCTPDISHDEQLSYIIRYVYISDNEIEISESFTGFLNVKDCTGAGLADTLVSHLKQLGLELSNCRGQAYDNGANMNPRAFFTPCGCHNLNLLLGDIAKVSPKAVSYFGTIQLIYTFLSASNHRYDVAKKYLSITPKGLSETRWECRVESVKAIRFQIKEILQVFE